MLSVGQALRDARLHKNLTVEEVSRVTKIRAARITDLESDDYTHFPNITYARSFLLLYAKYLGVDISKYPTVEVGSTVGLGDYQYLQSEEATLTHRSTRQVPDVPPEKPRWLIIFFVFLAMAAVGAFVGWGVMNIRRLGLAENPVKKDAVIVAVPTPVPSATPTPAPSPSVAQEMEIPAPPPLNLPPSPTPAPEVRVAEPLVSGTSDAALLAEAAATPSPAPTPATVGIPPQGELREIQLRATKKIRVRIVKDDPKTSSVYNGSLNPLMGPLTFQGKYFWIKVTDPSALQVTINGQPVSKPESGLEIARRPDL